MADQQQPLSTILTEFKTTGEPGLLLAFADLRKGVDSLGEAMRKQGQVHKEALDRMTGGVRDGIKEMNRLTGTAVQGGKEVGKAAEEGARKAGVLGDVLQTVAGRAAPSFASLAGAIGLSSISLAGLVGSGFAASAMGERFGTVMERLSLTVAGLFGPELMAISNILNDFTIKLQAMTPAQRQHIAYTIEAVAAAKLMRGAMLSLLPALGPVGALLVALGVGGMVSKEGIGGFIKEMKPLIDSLKTIGEVVANTLLPAVNAFAAALAPVLEFIRSIAEGLAEVAKLEVGGSKGKKGLPVGKIGVGFAAGAAAGSVIPGVGTLLGGLFGAAGTLIGHVATLDEEVKGVAGKGYRGALTGRGGGVEDVAAAYNRIAALSIRASAAQSIEEQHLGETKKIGEMLGKAIAEWGTKLPWVKPSR